MKRDLLVAASVCVLLLISCASRDNVSLTPEEEALAVKDALRIMRIKSDVTVEDVDDNGVLDIYIVYLSDKELTLSRRNWLFGGVTGVVVGSEENINWEVDGVYLEMGEELYRTTISECNRCMEGKRSEFDACLDEAWVRVE